MSVKTIVEAGWEEPGAFTLAGWTDDDPPAFVRYSYSPGRGWACWSRTNRGKVRPGEVPPEVIAAFSVSVN
jgi:hypothetical protein